MIGFVFEVILGPRIKCNRSGEEDQGHREVEQNGAWLRQMQIQVCSLWMLTIASSCNCVGALACFWGWHACLLLGFTA